MPQQHLRIHDTLSHYSVNNYIASYRVLLLWNRFLSGALSADWLNHHCTDPFFCGYCLSKSIHRLPNGLSKCSPCFEHCTRSCSCSVVHASVTCLMKWSEGKFRKNETVVEARGRMVMRKLKLHLFNLNLEYGEIAMSTARANFFVTEIYNGMITLGAFFFPAAMPRYTLPLCLLSAIIHRWTMPFSIWVIPSPLCQA